MKFTNNKKVALATIATTMASTVVNAEIANSEKVSMGLTSWIALVSEILSVLLIVIFAIYLSKFLKLKSSKDSEPDEKVLNGVRNGVMTSLVGVALCQAVIIVTKLFF